MHFSSTPPLRYHTIWNFSRVVVKPRTSVYNPITHIACKDLTYAIEPFVSGYYFIEVDGK
jgi:hypothetical protein